MIDQSDAMKDTPLSDSVLANRAEELGFDVWRYFVLPPFWRALNLAGTRKPNVIIGGRGSGKTMLLRFLSHYSQFSAHRPLAESDRGEAPPYVGLYWKIDTTITQLLRERDIDPSIWERAFQHLLALEVSSEIARALQNLANYNNCVFTAKKLSEISLKELRAFDNEIPTYFSDFERYLRSKRWALSAWASNPVLDSKPTFLPSYDFCSALLGVVVGACNKLEHTVFQVFVDEYENLPGNQAKHLNNALKHSEPPLIFNVAMKRNGWPTRETAGNELLQERDDFRIIDIDSELNKWFASFAAEVVLLRLGSSFHNLAEFKTAITDLQTETHLEERKSKNYQGELSKIMERMLPAPTYAEHSQHVFRDRRLRRQLESDLKASLKAAKSDYQTSDVMQIAEQSKHNTKVLQAIIVLPCLARQFINQPTNTNKRPDELVNQLKSLAKGEPNSFSSGAGWVHNYLVARLLQIYERAGVTPLLYAGFRVFVLLANGNIRHFLELCFQSLRRLEYVESDNEREFSIPVHKQAESARFVSMVALNEVKSAGPYRNQLFAFAHSLGRLLRLSQLRDTLSEPEITQFTIREGTELSDDVAALLKEAVKWGVLIEEEENKIKSKERVEDITYRFNPIFAPYFTISYRDKRKLELSSHNIMELASSSYDEKNQALNRFSKQWAIHGTDSLPLFPE